MKKQPWNDSITFFVYKDHKEKLKKIAADRNVPYAELLRKALKEIINGA